MRRREQLGSNSEVVSTKSTLCDGPEPLQNLYVRNGFSRTPHRGFLEPISKRNYRVRGDSSRIYRDQLKSIRLSRKSAQASTDRCESASPAH